MGLGDLTYDSVVRAVEEFDELGRDAFLAKYGFREARSYYLNLNGRLYDSKAIAGVAHQYARPDLGLLRAAKGLTYTPGKTHTTALIWRALWLLMVVSTAFHDRSESFKALLHEYSASETAVRLALPGGEMVFGAIAVVAVDHI
ncbi:MAG: hypothetical protein IIC72_11450, partial [Acidobacteria bacterium]|nr:hypothetical protein [Acidobacteriota bacterium]